MSPWRGAVSCTVNCPGLRRSMRTRSRSRICCTSCSTSTRSSAARGASAGRRMRGPSRRTMSQRRSPTRTRPRRRSPRGRAASNKASASATARSASCPAIIGRGSVGGRAAMSATKFPSASIRAVPVRDCQISAGTRSVISTERVPPPALRTEAEATGGSASTRLRSAARSMSNDEIGRSSAKVARTSSVTAGLAPSIDRTLMRNSGRFLDLAADLGHLVLKGLHPRFVGGVPQKRRDHGEGRQADPEERAKKRREPQPLHPVGQPRGAGSRCRRAGSATGRA